MKDIMCRCAYPQENFVFIFSLGVTPFLNLEIWQKWKILVNATPLKPLNRISWNFVVMKDIICRCAYPQEILIPFFFRSYALFELRDLAKMKDTTVFLVSVTPLKPLNRISWNFVVMKDIICRCAYPQEILIPFFLSLIHIWRCRRYAVCRSRWSPYH